ncbi:uncharacterized protein JCM6883_004399 [Sporobolomyces salmoneus]|uniref:uncharacterized protein n=1 Tax=Sporobolomyces salmoneus TaxID=183962 RepID=UPI00317BC1BF
MPSTSRALLDERPVKRVKVEHEQTRGRLNEAGEFELDYHRLKEDAQELLDALMNQRAGESLGKALKDYVRCGSPNKRIKSKLVPKVVRWDEGLALYRHGALRMTRTPGRRQENARNCISLEDLVKPESMLGMYSNTFLLEFDFIAPMLPILDHAHASRPVPIFLGQPLPPDPFLSLACSQTGISPPTHEKPRHKASEEKILASTTTQIYQEIVGRNLFAIHPKCSGCSHSKIFVIRYPGFLLVVITSANTMRLDMELCDNHWYIQAFPSLTPHQLTQKQAQKKNSGQTEFERILFFHLNELECPSEYISLLSSYDYSLAKNINLVVSHPGVVGPHEFDSRSIGRLAKIVRGNVKKEDRERVRWEVCCGSVGAMSKEWREAVEWLLRGKEPGKLEKRLRKRLEAKKEKEVQGEDQGETKRKKGKQRQMSDEDEAEEDEGDAEEDQSWKIIFPSKQYVATLSEEVQRTASNISSYWNTERWSQAPSSIKRLFYKYVSKDTGRLFHEKSILWFRSASSSSSRSPSNEPPLLFYLGSHNFSSAAWGTPSIYKDRPGLKTIGTNNYEIGIVVKGEKILEMLEKGSKSWEEIVTYKRPVERFDEGDVPWVSPSWAKKVREESGETEF